MTRLRPVSLLAAALAFSSLAGCRQEAAAPEPVRPVLTMTVEPLDAGGATIVGTVQPRYQTNLGFRVLGRLISRPVYVGDLVAQGQTVAAIDATALELAVRAATAEVANRQAQLANASGTEERQRMLLETNVATQATFESAEQARAAAQATVVRAQANLTKAREQLGYAQVKPDFAGVVTAVGAEVGQVVSPGQSVVTVARPDVREAVIDASEEVAAKLAIGTPFTVGLQLNPAITASGAVREIGPQADSATRTRRIRIALDNPPDTFRLGTTITATLASGQGKAFDVPPSGLLARDGKYFVWLADPAGQTVSLREIQGALKDDGSFRVTAGLDAGMRVVVAGVHSLTEGQKVRIDQDASL